MLNNIVTYSFSELNKKTIILVPGYFGGLEIPLFKELGNYFVQNRETNVFGIELDYENDTPDLFNSSQEILIVSVKEIVSKSHDGEVILLAKSLGGSLSLYNHQALHVTKIIILGSSLVLGWPQRISILRSESPTIPDYKSEWHDVLLDLNTPTLILSGDSDELTDNEFLAQIANTNKHVQLRIIEQANHNLEHKKTNVLQLQVLLPIVKSLVA